MADRAVWQRTIVDERGNIIPGAEVTVRSYPDGSLVTLYESPDGAPKSNPFVTGHDGFARFWAESQRAEIVAIGAGSSIRWIVDLLNADEVIGDAVTEATAAAAVAVGEAEAAADRAESARDAAQLNARIYPDTAAGLAATTDGDYFSVPSEDSDEYLILYRNDSGSAAEVERYPAVGAIENERHARQEAVRHSVAVSRSADRDEVRLADPLVALDRRLDPVLWAIVDPEDAEQLLPLIYFDVASGSVRIPTLEGGAEADPDWPLWSSPRQPLAEGLEPFDFDETTTLGFLTYGQSLSLGSAANGVIEPTRQWLYNRTFLNGVVVTKTGNDFGGSSRYPMTSARPLYERQPPNSSRGETIASAACNKAVILAGREQGVEPQRLRFFASAAGRGATSIELLKKDSPPIDPEYTQNWYTNVIDHITQAHAIETNEGQDYWLQFVAWLQGEGDFGTDSAVYAGHLEDIVDDISADAMAITGQDRPPYFLISQQTGNLNRGTNGPVLGQLLVADSRENVFVIGGTSHLPSADGTHLSPLGYHLLGHYFARAMKDILIDRRKPIALRARSAELDGDEIIVTFDVPVGPLVLDYVNLPPTQSAGFVVRSDAGDHGISSVRIVDTDKVALTLEGALGSNPLVRVCLDTAAEGSELSYSANTNLRDSSPDTARVEGRLYPLWNVCLSSQVTIEV